MLGEELKQSPFLSVDRQILSRLTPIREQSESISYLIKTQTGVKNESRHFFMTIEFVRMRERMLRWEVRGPSPAPGSPDIT